MKTGNRCLVMCVTCEMGCLGLEGEFEISHRQLYPGLDVQTIPLPLAGIQSEANTTFPGFTA